MIAGAKRYFRPRGFRFSGVSAPVAFAVPMPMHLCVCLELEGQLEKLLSDSRSSVAAAVATLKSASAVVQEHTEQIRRAMEVMHCH